jgi:hypothetical protein
LLHSSWPFVYQVQTLARRRSGYIQYIYIYIYTKTQRVSIEEEAGDIQHLEMQLNVNPHRSLKRKGGLLCIGVWSQQHFQLTWCPSPLIINIGAPQHGATRKTPIVHHSTSIYSCPSTGLLVLVGNERKRYIGMRGEKGKGEDTSCLVVFSHKLSFPGTHFPMLTRTS